MALADRRTTILVDMTVGNIELPDGYVSVPAKMELQDVDAKDAGGADSLKGMVKAIEKAMMAPIGAAFKKLTQFVVTLISKLGRALAPLVVIIGILVVTVKWAIWAFKFLGKVIMVLYGALKALYLGWWNVNKAIVLFLAKPVVATIRKSISVLREYISVLKELGQRVVEVTKQFTRNMVSNFAEFEQNVASAVTRMNEFGEAGMRMRNEVQRAVRDITLQSRKMASEAGQAWLWIASAGIQGVKNIQNMTQAAVMLSEATGEGLAGTSAIMVKMMNQFQLGSEQSMRAANALAAAIVGSPATLSDMAQALKYAGTTANLFGHSLEETLSMLMGLFQMGSTASTAGVEISQMFNAIAQGSDKTVKTLAKYGIALADIDPRKHKLYEIVAVFERLRDALAAQPGIDLIQANKEVASMLYQAFSQRAARGFASLMVIGSEALARFRKEITGTTTAQQMQVDQLNTLAGAWDIIKSKWEEIYYMVSDRFAPALRRGVELLKAFVDVLMRGRMPTAAGGILAHLTDTVTLFMNAVSGPALVMFNKLLPVLAKGALYVRAAFAAALPSVVTLLKYLPLLGKYMVETLGKAFVGMVKNLAPFLMEWVLKITPALGRLAAAFMDLIGALAAQAGPAIIAWFQTLIGMLTRVFGAAQEGIPLFVEYIQLLIDKLPQVLEAVIKVMPRVLSILSKFLENVANFVTVYLPLLVTWFGEVLNVAQTIVNETLPALIDGLRKASPYLIAIFREMMGGIEKALELIQTVLANWDAIIAPALETIIDALKTIFTEGGKMLSLWMRLAIVWVQIQALLLRAKLMLAGQFEAADALWGAVLKLVGPMREIADAFGAIGDAAGKIGSLPRTGGQVAEETDRTRLRVSPGPGYSAGGGQGGWGPSDVIVPMGDVFKQVQVAQEAGVRRATALGMGFEPQTLA